MNDRLHRALDGELDREDLTPAESAELDESTALFAGVLRSIPCDPLPDMGQAVVRKIEAMNQSARPSPRRNSGVAGWLWSSRTVSVRPAYALAAAAVFAIAFSIRATSSSEPVEPVQVAVAAAPSEVLVHF